MGDVTPGIVRCVGPRPRRAHRRPAVRDRHTRQEAIDRKESTCLGLAIELRRWSSGACCWYVRPVAGNAVAVVPFTVLVPVPRRSPGHRRFTRPHRPQHRPMSVPVMPPPHTLPPRRRPFRSKDPAPGKRPSRATVEKVVANVSRTSANVRCASFWALPSCRWRPSCANGK